MLGQVGEKKIAVITGSNSGIGLEIAKRFQEDGYIVVTNGRSVEKRNDFKSALYISADLTRETEVKKFVQEVILKFGKIDVLVCNVGSGRQILERNTNKRWEHFLNYNLFSAVNVIENLLDVLIENKSIVIGISSIAANVATPAPMEYSAAKSALETYFRSMAYMHGGQGLNFNLIAPGNIIFDDSIWNLKLEGDKKSTLEYLKQNVPSNRFGTAEEVAAAVAFLAAEKARFINGAVITVDGGQSL